MSLFLPDGSRYQSAETKALKAYLDSTVESSTERYFRHVQDLVNECLKDLSGGILPSKKRLKNLLASEAYTNGYLFKYRGRPMVFITRPKWRQDGSKMLMDVQHKKLYAKEPEQPAGATN